MSVSNALPLCSIQKCVLSGQNPGWSVKQVESLWTKNKVQTRIGDVVGVCSRPSHQQERADEAISEQVEKPYSPRHWCSWVTLTSAVTTARPIRLNTGNPDFWNRLKTTSWHRWSIVWWGEMFVQGHAWQHPVDSWRAKEPRRAIQSARTASSEHKNCSPHSQKTSFTGDEYEWMWSSWLAQTHTRKPTMKQRLTPWEG